MHPVYSAKCRGSDQTIRFSVMVNLLYLQDMAAFFTREFNWTRNTFKHIELHLMNIEDMSRRRK